MENSNLVYGLLIEAKDMSDTGLLCAMFAAKFPSDLISGSYFEGGINGSGIAFKTKEIRDNIVNALSKSDDYRVTPVDILKESIEAAELGGKDVRRQNDTK